MTGIGRYDAVLIGGGHNALVCACYLAAGGLKVRLLERLEVVGGAAVSEEFHPGFRNSVASYTVSLLHPKVIRELRLACHGLVILERPLGNFLPLSERPDDCLLLGAGDVADRSQLARFSAADAAALPHYQRMLDGVAGLLRSLLLDTPPRLAGGGVADLLRGLTLSRRLRRLDPATRRDALELFTVSAGEVLERWFETPAIQAAFGFDSVVGSFQSPYSAGSGYVLLHHVFGEVNGKPGRWGHAVGGMGAITQAMAAEAEARGVEISLGAEVSRVLCRNGRAVGVLLADGSEIDARAVVSGVTPKLLYQQLVEPGELTPEFRRRVDAYRCGSGSFRINLALSELPAFSCLPAPGDHLGAGIIIAPSLNYMEQAYFDARSHGWSSRPIVEMLIPSTVDRSLAPPGCHVASLFCQHFSPDLTPYGLHWDRVREQAAEAIIDTVTEYAPNFKASILGRQVLSPLDLERRFGLSSGDIFHGALRLNQLYSARPVLGYGDYRGPLAGLYHCASGAHPGGGVSGIPGHNAAREILKDLRRPGRTA